MENNTTMLVSVVVIAYNSSRYVLETLESVKAQTYQNIELIVSDDCSTDNTVELCKNWIEVNRDRFVRVELITIDKNTGISPNCNRGYKMAQGEWVKGVAGDDTLLPNCVEDNVHFVLTHPDAKVVHSKALVYLNSFDDNNFVNATTVNEFFTEQYTAREQFSILSFKNYIFALTVFIEKKTWIISGGFDESIKLSEDYPMWLKLTYNGIKFHYLDALTGNYRSHNQSMVHRRFFVSQVIFDVYKKHIRNYSSLCFRAFFMYGFSLRVIFERTRLMGRLTFIYDLLQAPYNYYFSFVRNKIRLKNTGRQ
jgi:alpha-1,3-rhamnosyltransferase